MCSDGLWDSVESQCTYMPLQLACNAARKRRKIYIPTRCVLALKMRQIRFRPGLRPNPAEELTTPPDLYRPIVGW